MGEGTCDVGLNTVLGGAFFVTCVVVGIKSISRGWRVVQVHKSAFIRDVCFLLLVLVFLLVILIQEEIGFSSMYVVYVIAQGCKCFLDLED